MYRMAGIDESKEWFAFRIRPRHEKQVALTLREKGFNEFLPLLKLKRQWADRTKVVEMPLFPGYIFCSTTRAAIVPVLITNGVIDVVRAGNTPSPADRVEIEALQQAVRFEVPLEAWPYKEWQDSQMCSILHGPLAGLHGTLVKMRAGRSLVLSINLLRKSILVEVQPDWIAPYGGESGVPKVDERKSA